jgi:hypothetical protein
MSTTTDKEKALLIQLDLENAVKAAHLPMLCIIGLPDSGGFVRSSLSLKGPHNTANRQAFLEAIADYFAKLESESE